MLVNNRSEKYVKKLEERGNLAFDFIIKNLEIETVLDIGCGYGIHSDKFKQQNKKVTSTDYISKYPGTIEGLYENLLFSPHDLTWACHVLEHVLNPHNFLKKIRKDTKVNGYVCITVPPARSKIVSGHVSLWNPGILMYHLILAGFDCSNAHIKTYGNNISVIAQAKEFELPSLGYDVGDLKKISKYFPEKYQGKFDGNILEHNWY